MKEDLSQQLYVESIKTIYTQNTGVSSLTFPATGFLLFYVWSQTGEPTLALYIWYACLSAFSLYAFFKIRKVKLDSDIDFHTAKKYSREMCLINLGISGLISFFFLYTELVSDRFAYLGMLYLAANMVVSVLGLSLNTAIYLTFISLQIVAGAYRYLDSIYWLEFFVGLGASALFSASILRVTKRNFRHSFLLRHENRELLADIQKKKVIAEKANKAKTKFLAAASHDLRQPLQSITLLLAALSRHISEKKQTEILNKARDSVSSLSDLLNSLLDISKLDSGLIVNQPIHFSISDLLRVEIEEFQTSAKDKGLEINDCVEDDLFICSDPILVKRVVGNLLDNAINYTEHGSINVTAKTIDKSVYIAIRDTGIGISESEQKNIFQEFYQLDNPERDRRKGLGLGLSIVERLCLILGANLEFHSDKSGTTFEITIPNQELTETPPEETASKSQSTNSPGEAKYDGLCVVIVDDEIDVRESMEWLLESCGCTSISAASEEEVLERLETKNVKTLDAMVVDYRLRDNKTGLECAASVMDKLGSKIPTIVITGDTESSVLKSIQASGHSLLHKPIEPTALFKFLDDIEQTKTIKD